MKIQRTILDQRVACLTLTGDFDAFAANPFLEQIESLVQSGTGHVAVNMRLVLFINSTAVGSLIKARKRLRGMGGDLVLSEPSARVKETMELLGLAALIKSHANDAEAAAALRANGHEQVDVPADNAVLIRFNDAAQHKRYAEVGGMAKMASLEENSIAFLAGGETSLFPVGAAIKAKFRLPLFMRAYYFDFPCTIRTAERTKDGIKVTAEFGDIVEDDRKAIAQFVRDLRLLREEARGGS
ncbi:MAG: STAS domain-containing protein [Planctomycetes bacterium]|nr:STAS domain-containing protein [Planctomycetota bacterium]